MLFIHISLWLHKKVEEVGTWPPKFPWELNFNFPSLPPLCIQCAWAFMFRMNKEKPLTIYFPDILLEKAWMWLFGTSLSCKSWEMAPLCAAHTLYWGFFLMLAQEHLMPDKLCVNWTADNSDGWYMACGFSWEQGLIL